MTHGLCDVRSRKCGRAWQAALETMTLTMARHTERWVLETISRTAENWISGFRFVDSETIAMLHHFNQPVALCH